MADTTTNKTSNSSVTWGSATLFAVFVFFFFNFYQLIHEKFFVERSVDQFGRSITDYGVDVLWIGLGILIVGSLFACILLRKVVWKHLTSVRLGVVLMIAVTLGAALGTMIFQNAPKENYIGFYGEGLSFVFERLNMVDIYRSWWFIAYEVLLSVSLLATTVRRKPWTHVSKWGPGMIHIGIIILVIGALYGTANLVDAILYVGEGEETEFAIRKDFVDMFHNDFGKALEAMLPANIDQVPDEFKIPLGGTYRLDDFDELYYEEPYIVSVGQQGTRKDLITGAESNVTRSVMQFDIDDAKAALLPEGLGKFSIVKTYKNYMRAESLVDFENGRSMAQASFTMPEGATPLPDLILTEAVTMEGFVDGIHASHGTSHGDTAFKLSYSWFKPEITESAAKLLTIDLRQMSAEVEPMAYPLDVGDSFELANGIKVTLSEFYPAFHVELDADGNSIFSNSSESMTNPTAILVATGGTLTENLTMTISAMGGMMDDPNVHTFFNATQTVPMLQMETQYKLVIVGETKELLVYDKGTLAETVNLAEGGYKPVYSDMTISLVAATPSGTIEITESNENPVSNFAVEVEIDNDGVKKTQLLELLDNTISQQQVEASVHRYFLVLDDRPT
jgi:hypothetical protein